jgi:hypothetical protein
VKKKFAARLFQLSTYLVKGFCATSFSLLVFTLLSAIFGLAELGFAVFSAVLPWLLRAGLAIGCTIAITSISEGI